MRPIETWEAAGGSHMVQLTKVGGFAVLARIYPRALPDEDGFWNRLRILFAWRNRHFADRTIYQENLLTGDRRALRLLKATPPIREDWLTGWPWGPTEGGWW